MSPLFSCSLRFLKSLNVNFSLKFLADTCPFWGPLVPWWRLLWGSKPELVLPYSLFAEANVMYIHSPRSTSGVTCANLLAVGLQPALPDMHVQKVGLGVDSKGRSPGQKTNALQLCQRPGHMWTWPLVDVLFGFPVRFPTCMTCVCVAGISCIYYCLFWLTLISL